MTSRGSAHRTSSRRTRSGSAARRRSAPREGDTMRTAYGAATRSAGLKIQLAISPPAPQTAAIPPASTVVRSAALRRPRAPPPKISSAIPHCSGRGRLLTMCAITIASVSRSDGEEDRRRDVARIEREMVLGDELRIHRVLEPRCHRDRLRQRVAHIDELIVQIQVHMTLGGGDVTKRRGYGRDDTPD